MKYINLLIGAMALTAMTGCNIFADSDDGLPRLPKYLKSRVLGSTYSVDTLYQSGSNAYCVVNNYDYGQHILYDNDRVYASNPLMRIDSVSGSRYSVGMLSRTVVVDFADASTLAQIDSVVPVYPEFKRFSRGYEISDPVYAVCGYTVDVPKSDVPEHGQVQRWLATVLGDTVPSHAEVDLEEYGERCAKMFFDTFDTNGEPIEQSADWCSADFASVYYYDPAKYVTYLNFNYQYTGGAHGMYGIGLATYSFEKGEGVTLDNLFKPGSNAAIRDLVYEAMAADPGYTENHRVSTPAQVKAEMAAMGISELPLSQPALMPEGILFCYQPYEIGPYCDGALQFLVPWSAAAPYLK